MATYLTYQGHKHRIDVPAVTLRNHKAMIAWSEKLDKQAKKDNQSVQLAAVRKMLDTFPEALDYIDAVGNVNSAKLQARIDYIQADETRKAKDAEAAGATYDRMSDDAVREEAYKWVMDKWQNWVKDNPGAAMMLMFQATEYPTDIESLLLGIECLKATALAAPETRELIDGDLDTDFWQDADAAEVAAYCTSFCKAYKSN